MPFVFVHGWGMAPDFWDRLVDCLPGIESQRVDLGFIGTHQDTADNASEGAVYITHSLGTMWALKNHHADMKALIAINGFGCFQNYANARVLRAMALRLQKDPKAQMEDFWTMCGLPSSDDLNTEKLKDGLEWLSSWNERKTLDALECPVLALAGQDDPILSIDAMKAEWEKFGLHVCKAGGHALPISHAEWCAHHIEAFVHAL